MKNIRFPTESFIVAADILSAARPGARRDAWKIT